MKKKASSSVDRPRVLARVLAEELRAAGGDENYVVATNINGRRDITDWAHDDTPGN